MNFLANNIRYLRRSRNLSQEELSKRLGYKSFTTIQKWETGIATPPFKKLKELSNIFNVDIDILDKKDLSAKENIPVASLPSVLPDDEASLLEDYRSLNELGKSKASDYVRDLAENDRYKKGPSTVEQVS